MSFELLPYIGVVAALAAFFLSVKQSVKVYSEGEGQNLIINQRALVSRDQIRNHSLDGHATNEAIYLLSTYAKELNPDFIIGINRGGAMVGAFLSMGLGIPSDRFVRCLVSRKAGYKVSVDLKHVYGTVLVIDDICRSGDTISQAVKKISNKNKNIKIVRSAVLVSTQDKNRKLSYKELDFHSYATSDQNVRLPWTPVPMEGYDIEKIRLELFKRVRTKPVDEIAQEVISSIYQPNKGN